MLLLPTACIDSGFSSALVRKQNPTEADYNTVFYCNLLTSFIIYILLFLGAPNIASFYESTHPYSTLPKPFLHILNKRFRTYPNSPSCKRNTIQKSNNYQFLITLFISMTALYYALHNYGAWALVAQMLSQSVSKTILLWIIGKWHPKAIFSIKSFP